MKCILGGRGWVGSTHLGTSWEPQQDLEGRRGFIYTELALIYIRQSAVHMQGDANEATHGAAGTLGLKSLFHFLQNQTAGLQLMSAFDGIIISAASHGTRRRSRGRKTSARESRPENLIELAD